VRKFVITGSYEREPDQKISIR
jgi:hypothetical protein